MGSLYNQNYGKYCVFSPCPTGGDLNRIIFKTKFLVSVENLFRLQYNLCKSFSVAEFKYKNGGQMKKIYIADDERNIREIMTGFLSRDGFEVKAFETGDQLFYEFKNQACDLVILDIMMPGTDGLSICNAIRQMHNVPIIIVSARDSELDRITGITMGGDDYLVKPFSPMELVARVKSIFRRIELERMPLQAALLNYGDIEIDLDMMAAKQNGTSLDFTPTEFALLSYMFKNSGRAVSREEILKNVWKFDFEVDTRACDDVLKRLRKKLLTTKVRITSVWGFGFKLETA